MGFQTRLLAIMLGMTATMAVWYLQPKYQWSGIERHYLTHYILASAGWFKRIGLLSEVR